MLPWPRWEFTEKLETVGRDAYHDRHPFHLRMLSGSLDRQQMRTWVANRFYYQKSLPIKDAALLARCPIREVRQAWIHRIIDQDGTADRPGALDLWLKLGEAVGLERAELEEDQRVLPGVRFAVDAYVHFVQTHDWIEGVASSLTERFAPALLGDRLSALQRHYGWIDPDALDCFRLRLVQAPRDAEFGLRIVLDHCRTRETQERAVAALRFKCELLWAQLDVLNHHLFGAPAGMPSQPTVVADPTPLPETAV